MTFGALDCKNQPHRSIWRTMEEDFLIFQQPIHDLR